MKLLQKILIVAELCGRPMSDGAILAMVAALTPYGEAAHAALERCSRECDRLSLPEVLKRMPGAAPGPDEAWSIASAAYNEAGTVVWTDAIAESFGAVRHMSDRVAARMAFKEAYARAVAEVSGLPQWWVSPGQDASSRESAVRSGVAAGRLPSGELERLMPPRLALVTGDE